MLTVHHLENSRSQRILRLLEELAVEYKIKRYQGDARGQAELPGSFEERRALQDNQC